VHPEKNSEGNFGEPHTCSLQKVGPRGAEAAEDHDREPASGPGPAGRRRPHEGGPPTCSLQFGMAAVSGLPKNQYEREVHDALRRAEAEAAAADGVRVPRTFAEAMASSVWRPPLLKELARFKHFNVIGREVSPDELGSRKPLRVIFHFSIRGDGSPKVRIVLDGSQEIAGVHYDNGRALSLGTPDAEAKRFFFAMAAAQGCTVVLGDAVAAYLQAEPLSPLYAAVPRAMMPDGGAQGGTCVVQLNKAVYGAHESGRAWQEHFDRYLVQIGFVQLGHARGVYRLDSAKRPDLYEKHGNAYVLAYIDDLAVALEHAGMVQQVLKAIEDGVQMDMNPPGQGGPFVGSEVHMSGAGITLAMRRHTANLLRISGAMAGGRRTRTAPSKRGELPPLQSTGGEPRRDQVQARYATLVGVLQYMAREVRLDLLWSVQRLAKFVANPQDEHVAELEHLCEYVQDTAEMGITYSPTHVDGMTVDVYTDANFPGSHTPATSGVVVLVNGSVVIARSVRQSRSSRSAAEAELYAFVAGLLAVEYVLCVLADYQTQEFVISLHGDNKACLSWVTSHVTNQATKHFIQEVRYAQEIVERMDARVQYVPSANNLADVFTKHLAGAQIRPLLSAMSMGAVAQTV